MHVFVAAWLGLVAGFVAGVWAWTRTRTAVWQVVKAIEGFERTAHERLVAIEAAIHGKAGNRE